MKTEKLQRDHDGEWSASPRLSSANLVLAFGSRESIAEPGLAEELKRAYPHAHIAGCSTSGEINGTEVCDGTLVVNAVEFEKTAIKAARVNVSATSDSRDAGRRLAERLDPEGLAHVFVLADGLIVNGSDLVEGLTERLPESISMTGGQAGDADRLEQTLVMLDGPAQAGDIVAIGFYGDSLEVGYGSVGGWDAYGPVRRITKSEGNVLFDLDDKPVLEMYRKYLGEYARELPASGLLFPLNIRRTKDAPPVVRTVIAANEEDGSMTFAGAIPKEGYAQLMKANINRLTDGAESAAELSLEGLSGPPELAILISCTGRKFVFKQQVEEETEAVRGVLGDQALMSGFYSYGEISPFSRTERQCELHNQTMTVTTFLER